jgi:hypothetical protein
MEKNKFLNGEEATISHLLLLKRTMKDIQNMIPDTVISLLIFFQELNHLN